MRASSVLALAASLSSVSAVYQGFNYGSTKEDGSTIRVQSDFQSLFATAKSLVGAPGVFSSARLYTTVQGGTASDPTSAIPAAIAEGTSLLLGLWASGGQAGMTNEINALKTAISKYGSSFTNLVAGISVGSEDLYRISPTGIAAKSGLGAAPSDIANYISQVRSAIAGTGLSTAPVGHVDTWTAWVNGSNSAVIEACDFIGMDAYPYFQNTQANSIENGASLFNDALAVTQQAAGGKEVWITETGFPVSGAISGDAQPSLANAKTYWDAVGCPNFGKVNTWWFTLEDTDNATPNPSFGITSGNPLSTTPLFDLSCSAVSSSSSSAASSSATSSGASSASSASSVASSASLSSVSSAATATSGLASSGAGLAPSQGNGIGGNTSTASATGASASATGIYPSVTGATGGNSTSVVTSTAQASGTVQPSGSSSGTSTATPTPVAANGASGLAGSVLAAAGVLIAAVMAL